MVSVLGVAGLRGRTYSQGLLGRAAVGVSALTGCSSENDARSYSFSPLFFKTCFLSSVTFLRSLSHHISRSRIKITNFRRCRYNLCSYVMYATYTFHRGFGYRFRLSTWQNAVVFVQAKYAEHFPKMDNIAIVNRILDIWLILKLYILFNKMHLR